MTPIASSKSLACTVRGMKSLTRGLPLRHIGGQPFRVSSHDREQRGQSGGVSGHVLQVQLQGDRGAGESVHSRRGAPARLRSQFPQLQTTRLSVTLHARYSVSKLTKLTGLGRWLITSHAAHTTLHTRMSPQARYRLTTSSLTEAGGLLTDSRSPEPSTSKVLFPLLSAPPDVFGGF